MHSRARKTDAGGVTLRDRLRHGSTTAEGTDKAPTTAYVQYSDYWGRVSTPGLPGAPRTSTPSRPASSTMPEPVMPDTVRATQFYLENLVAGAFAPRVRVSLLYVETVRAYQAAPTTLRVTQIYLESVRSRLDAPVPPPGGGGRTGRSCRSRSDAAGHRPRREPHAGCDHGGAACHRRSEGRCRQPQPARGAQVGGQPANGVTRVLGTSYALYDDRFEVDPASGAARTKAGVDALKAGVEVMA